MKTVHSRYSFYSNFCVLDTTVLGLSALCFMGKQDINRNFDYSFDFQAKFNL